MVVQFAVQVEQTGLFVLYLELIVRSEAAGMMQTPEN